MPACILHARILFFQSPRQDIDINTAIYPCRGSQLPAVGRLL